ncbi:MAG: protealysin inhibitor emfourin [Saprospiraceae bacterium]|nr:protealysin inhibitor emfourin [Saprospiraceae bacterium]
MKINIKQEGGFMGLASKAKLDYKTLTEEEQKTLDAIAERAVAKLEEEPKERGMLAPMDSGKAPLLRASVPADTLCYSVSMKKDGKKVDIAFDDTNAPPELIAFFQKYIKF